MEMSRKLLKGAGVEDSVEVLHGQLAGCNV